MHLLRKYFCLTKEFVYCNCSSIKVKVLKFRVDLPFIFFLDSDFGAMLTDSGNWKPKVSATRLNLHKSQATKAYCHIVPTGLVAFFLRKGGEGGGGI